MAAKTVLEDVQEIQPWCRITATSQSHRELSTNVPFLEAGPGVWGGCGSEQLAATVPWASVYSGALNTPGAPAGVLELYIYIIYDMIYRYLYGITVKSCLRLPMILCISNDCVGFSDASGSSTSTSILRQNRLNRGMEERGIVARGCLPSLVLN